MYRMSSGAERLIKEKRITVEIFAKKKTHTIFISKKGVNDPYVIQLKMIDLQKGFSPSKLMLCSNQKNYKLLWYKTSY